MHTATIAIITCKRVKGLTRLLNALAKQKLEDWSQIKIIVVDNANDSLSKNAVYKFARYSEIEVDYYVEPTPGIVAARNKCIEIFLKSDSENLIFIDDDEWPERDNWVSTMLKSRYKHSADIVAGDVLSVKEDGTPDWALKVLYHRKSLKEGTSVKNFYTGNVLISRNVLKNITPAFDSRFAVTGASDYHFALKCYKQKFRAIYTNAPVVEEFLKSRATTRWFIMRGFRSGIGYTRAHIFEDVIFIAILKCLTMSLVRFSRGVGIGIFGIFTLSKYRQVDGLFRISSALGTIAGFFGIKYNEYNTIHGA